MRIYGVRILRLHCVPLRMLNFDHKGYMKMDRPDAISAAPDTALPPVLQISRYRLTLQAVEPLHLPPYKGSALRGGFGHVFKRMVCAQQWPCGERCAGGNECPYGYVFETRPPADSQALRKNEHVPHPFLIEPPLDRRTEYARGDELIFHLVLVGQAQAYLNYFIITFQELGRVGLGSGRGQYRLTRVEALHPLRDETASAFDESRSNDIVIPSLAVTAAEVEAWAAALPSDEIHLRFLTPTRLVFKEDAVTRPPFQVLVRRLLDRVDSLSYFHCGQRWQVDFRAVGERAEAVKLAECHTRWMQVERYSGRQQERVSLGGFVGDVVYRGDLAKFRSLLLLGSLIHVGKATIFGNGLYQIMVNDGDAVGSGAV
jgi:hypothetical protein